MELREGWLAALLLTDLAGPDEDVRHGDAGEGEDGVQRGRQQRQHEGVAEAAVQPEGVGRNTE